MSGHHRLPDNYPRPLSSPAISNILIRLPSLIDFGVVSAKTATTAT
jgi:hypothetical protein